MIQINTSLDNSQHFARMGLPETGNAFNWSWSKPSVVEKPKRIRALATMSEERREQHRESQRAYSQSEAGRKSRAAAKQREKLKAAATRVNREDFAISQTPQADRDKTNKLLGRSFQGRSA